MFKKKKNLLKIVLIIFSSEKITLSSMIEGLVYYGSRMKDNSKNLKKKNLYRLLSGTLSSYIFNNTIIPYSKIEKNKVIKTLLKAIPGIVLPDLISILYKSEYFKNNKGKFYSTLIIPLLTYMNDETLNFDLKNSLKIFLTRFYSSYWKDNNLVNIKFQEIIDFLEKKENSEKDLIKNQKKNQINNVKFQKIIDFFKKTNRNKNQDEEEEEEEEENQNKNQDENNNNYYIVSRKELALNLLYLFSIAIKHIPDKNIKNNEDNKFIKNLKDKINKSINNSSLVFSNILLFLSKDQFETLNKNNKTVDVYDKYKILTNSNSNNEISLDKSKSIITINNNGIITNDFYKFNKLENFKNIISNYNNLKDFNKNDIILNTLLKNIFDISFFYENDNYKYIDIFIKIIKNVINNINYDYKDEYLKNNLKNLLDIQVLKLDNLKKNLNKYEKDDQKIHFLKTIELTKNFFNIHLVKYLSLLGGSFLTSELFEYIFLKKDTDKLNENWNIENQLYNPNIKKIKPKN